MPRHVIVDGSNLATEGRSMPSLQQLVDAVQAFMEEYPNDLVTVVVDATFGHRIDPSEIAEFDAAIEHNELVAPPAGAVGRGDAFVLAIANKVDATIISNDSYQEFHAEYDWLFDEGRLIGGKPVPHIGWVFVPRVPVRGPLSRRVTRDAKRKDRSPASSRPSKVALGSKEASQPLPVPSAPPPGARLSSRRGRGRGAAAGTEPEIAAAELNVVAGAAPAAASAEPKTPKTTHVATPTKSSMVNDLLPFIAFVEQHPVGSTVEAVVESYASHGAYVRIGDARGYVPLRLMDDPAPRSARLLMKLDDTVILHVAAFHPARRGIDLATSTMAHTIEIPEPEPKAPKRSRKKAAAEPVIELASEPDTLEVPPVPAADVVPTPDPAALDTEIAPEPASPAPAKRTRKKAAAAAPARSAEPARAAKPARRKAAPAAEPAAAPAAEPAAAPVAAAEPAPAKRTRKKATPAAAEPVPAAVAQPAPAKRARKKAAPPAEPPPVASPPAPAAPVKRTRKKAAAG